MRGDLPPEWRRVALSEVAEISRGVSWRAQNEAAENAEGALPVLGIRNVQAKLELGDLTWLTGLGPAAIASSTVQRGDILMVGSNGNPARIGNSVQVDAPGRFLFASLLFGLRPRDEVVDRDFLFNIIESSEIQEAISETVQGTTGLSNLKISVLRDIAVMLPPLAEQGRIVEVLRSIRETAMHNERCALDAASLRSALLSEHFHRADWEPNRPLPAGWTVALLDDVAKRGSGHTPNKKVPSYWGGGISWVSLQDTKRLDKVYIHETAESITAEGIANSSAVLHPAGTVVISRDATVGRSAITTSEMAVSQHFIAYLCGPKVHPLYLYYWFQRMKSVFERIGAGSTIKTIGLPFFKGLRIALPPIAQQIEIANQMLGVDCAIDSERFTTDRTRSLKTGVASDLLAGRVRVPA